MNLEFFKMQANGNDYVFFDFLDKNIPKLNYNELSKWLSDRHYSIGSDGIVLILDDKKNDAFMCIFNADGSEAKMCGTALMCVISYLSGKLPKTNFTINTLSGIKTGIVQNESVKVNMGIPKLLKNQQIKGFDGFLVRIGNDHFVTFVDELSENIAEKYGPTIENDPEFPDGINVQFVEVLGKDSINMKIWERGSGTTMACGTGSCAAVFAGISEDILVNNVQVQMPGGTVHIEYKNSSIFLIGIPKLVFTGNFQI